MLKVITTFAWLCYCLNSNAQGINKYYEFTNYTYNDFINLIINDNELILNGVAISIINNKFKQGINYFQLDTLGNKISNYFDIDTIKNYNYTMSEDYGDFIMSRKKDKFISIFPTYENKEVNIVELDKNFEPQKRLVVADTSYASNFDYEILELSNSDYLLFGSIQWPPKKPSKIPQIVGFVRRIDKEGNTMWLKYYSPSFWLNRIESLQPLTDSTFVFVLSSDLSTDASNPNPFNTLYIIDDKGNTLKTWRSQNFDANYTYIEKIVGIEEDKILLYGHKYIDNYNWNDRNYQPYVTAFDFNLKPIWQKYCGIKSNVDFINNGLQAFHKTIDGNYVGVGMMGFNHYFIPKEANWAWIYKFTPQGEEIWTRKIDFLSNYPPLSKTGDLLYLNSVGILSSGSIIAAGKAKLKDNTYGYLVKLSNDGCLDTLFKCDKIIDLKDNVIDEQLIVSIFPNPSSDVINIKFKENSRGYQLILKDNNGKTYKSDDIESEILETQMNIENMANGIYFLEVHSKFRQPTFHKIIIIH